ncbi:MAG TPA: hypothetical protein VH165_19555, partial [Kofleriaceae bacterium]|nr:hypothetical protein [Kofleriaceae bacterium]
MTAPYRWTFYRSGGVDQVALQSRDDLIHLAELDPKLWIALSMPTRGVELDARTLDLLDTDHDGHIRHPEVLAALAWVRDAYKDVGRLLEGGDVVALDTLRDGPVLVGARRLLANLDKSGATEVALGDAVIAKTTFSNTLFNGDGVILPECAEGEVRGVIADIMTTHGTVTDRSGKPGIDKPRSDAFFTEAAALIAWQAKADPAILALGEATAAAADAVRAVRSKIDDYFTRCRLAAFDARAATALNVNEAELAALSTKELSPATAEIASLPIARVDVGAALPLGDSVNPAWSARLAELERAAVRPLLGARTRLTEADWAALVDKLAGYEAWRDARPANTIEPLGLDRIRVAANPEHQRAIEALIEQDLAIKPELDSMVDVEQLCRYQRDLVKLLRNYVNFSEFYARKGAVFQAGTLYLDGRGCTLVVDVIDAAKHTHMAPMAGAYLAYCDCVRGSEKKTIAAAFTAGDIDNLMVGRNGVFVDRQGHDWEATITKVIENPISIRQAFWAPYKKAVRIIEERVAKRSAEADAANTAKLSHAADPAPAAPGAPGAPGEPAAAPTPAPPPPPVLPEPTSGKFDIGTIAALGVAIGGIGAFGTAVMASIFGLGWWAPLGIAGIMFAISGPSMLLAFIKLRRRNLGPLLDANGWAINSLTRINVPFGSALTDVAALPPGAQRSARDPYAEKRRPWR